MSFLGLHECVFPIGHVHIFIDSVIPYLLVNTALVLMSRGHRLLAHHRAVGRLIIT